MELASQTFRLLRNLTSVGLKPDRTGSLARINNFLEWHTGRRLPTTSLRDVVGELAGTEVLASASTHRFELPLTEKVALMTIIRHEHPRLIVEMGTYTGATTVAIARAAGTEAVVHTLDLPEDEIVWGDEVKSAIGARLGERADSDAEIIAHRCSTRKFDFVPFEKTVDLVYIDASHEYEDVLHDSRAALRIVRPGGLIIWDDYQPAIPGVVRALDKLSREMPISHLSLTRLALLRRG